ncbi:TspO/MBR family protein [Phreatobacter sp.]|uniref:TspO/MBR family protein n=1 Tax=Phreatobacter sp. TaxID=1966341 RepID=UPI003F72F9FE
MNPSRSRWIATHAAFVVICLAVAAAGGLANSYGLTDWYPRIAKPWFNPPNWVFGPVWTVLYLMIAVAGARFALLPAHHRALPVITWVVQLAVNLAWSWVFFYGQAIGCALVTIAALWVSIVATILAGWTKDRLASLLLIPYLLWVSFAAVLNFAIWRLNG